LGFAGLLDLLVFRIMCLWFCYLVFLLLWFVCGFIVVAFVGFGFYLCCVISAFVNAALYDFDVCLMA